MADHFRCGYSEVAIALIVSVSAMCTFQPAGPAAAATPSTEPCRLAGPERHTVASVTDGETLTLTDGTVVRLMGAKAPRAPLGYRGDQPWPLVDAAREELARLAQGAEVELSFGGTRKDRHGRALAQVFVVKGDERVWLQGELVAKGLARVYSFPDNRACVAALLAREQDARKKRLGVWRLTAYRIQEASDTERLSRLSKTYQLVEGVVAAVGGNKSRVYLNFAEDWRTDFTISVGRKAAIALKEEGLDLSTLAGKRLRVRGWVEWRNGPMIEVTHVGQIEMLPGGAADRGSGESEPARPGKTNGMAL